KTIKKELRINILYEEYNTRYVKNFEELIKFFILPRKKAYIMNNDKQTKDFSLSSFIKLIKSTNPSIWMLSVGIFGSLLATITNLALPLFARNVIDGVSLDLLNAGVII